MYSWTSDWRCFLGEQCYLALGMFRLSHPVSLTLMGLQAFYINLPIAALLSPVYFFVFPPNNPRSDINLKQKFALVDWVGTILNAAVFVLFMSLISFDGSTFAWNSGTSIALFVVFGVCLIAYALQQTFSIFTTEDNRVFPVHFLKSRTLVLLYTATAGGGAAQAIPLYYIPLFFQFTRGDTALQAAVRLLPFLCIYMFFVMLAGGSLPVVGRYNLYYIVGGCLIIAGGAVLCTIDAHTSAGRIYGANILVAAGLGLVWQNAYAVAVVKVHPKDISKALGFINVAQIGTVGFALAIGGSIFQNVGFQELKSAFAGYGYPGDYLRSALAGRIAPIFSLSNGDVVELAVIAVAKTIRKVFAMVVAAGGVVLVSGLLMKFEKIKLEIVAGG